MGYDLIMRIDREKQANILKILVGLLLFFLIYLYRYLLVEIFAPVIIAIVFAYILNPFVKILEKKVPRVVALLILYGIITSILLFLIIFIIPKFINEMKGLIRVIPHYSYLFKSQVQQLQQFLTDMGIPGELRSVLDQHIASLENISIHFMNVVIGIISRLISVIGWFFVIPVLSFYFLKDREYFAGQMLYLIPIRGRSKVRRFGREIHLVLNQFLRGQFLISIIVGLLTIFGLMVVGVKYSLILGFFMGIFNLIPYFGPIMGAIPILVIAILESKGHFIYALVVVVIVQQIESSLISPKVIGDSIGVHPVYVILSLIAGGYLFGVLGMLVAVPAMLIMRITVITLYKEILYR